jgi:2-oxoglutarate dehydrogenase E1 component
MYKRIEARRSVRKLYTERLVNRGDLTVEEAEQALDDFRARLQAAFDETRQSRPPEPPRVEARAEPAASPPSIETGVDRAVLDQVVEGLHRLPDGFTLHPKLVGLLDARDRLYEEGTVDWSRAETLAFGSVLLEGTDIRLAGQDTRRGTFSQRHAVLVDYETGQEHVPLAHLGAGPGKFRVYDSLLSEYAALGFEYGYSVVHHDALVAWEAQFGDFANAAQVVVDQFLVAAEDKWGQTSGLVLLLPHGYEGQGPEHSSARIERFLQLAADDNMAVVNPSTAAQYFHVLRRQVRRTVRRPLVIATPKSLLRARHARSPVEELTTGSFRPVLDDPGAPDPAAVRRLVLCSGKVAYDLLARRDAESLPVAVVRVEELYPWPASQVQGALDRYTAAADVTWVQEEPANMGGGSFVEPRLRALVGDRVPLRLVGRPPSGSPATGSFVRHQAELDDLLGQAFTGLSP